MQFIGDKINENQNKIKKLNQNLNQKSMMIKDSFIKYNTVNFDESNEFKINESNESNDSNMLNKSNDSMTSLERDGDLDIELNNKFSFQDKKI